MRILAAIFDVYGTLLELGPSPESQIVRESWEAICDEHLGPSPPPDLAQIIEACDAVVARENSVASQLGITRPKS